MLLCYILIIRSATYNAIVYKGQGKDAKSWIVMTFLALVVCMLGKKEILATDGISQKKMKNKTA